MRVGNTITIGNMSSVGAGIIDPDAQIFIERVIADGGIVEDPAFLNSFVLDAKANNYFNDIVAAYSPSWGVRINGDGADKLYSISGAGSDIVQVSATSRPSVESGTINGKDGILFDGVTDYFSPKAFAHPQPATNIMLGARQITWGVSRRFYDGFSNINMSLLQDFISPGLSAYAGATASAGGDWTLGEYRMSRVLFNGVASEASIDEATTTTINAGTQDGDGLTIGTNGAVGSLRCNFDMGAFVMMGSAVDGSYDGKMAAIRDFGASAYDTPWGGYGVKGSTTYGNIGDSIVETGYMQSRITLKSPVIMDATGGVGGDDLGEVAARTTTYLNAVPTQQKTFVFAGINNVVSAVSDPNAVMQSDLMSIVEQIEAASKVPILSNITPWKAHVGWTQTKQDYTDTYNAWIEAYAAINGYLFVNSRDVLSTDGETLLPAYDSGDGLHPNQDGSSAVGDEFNIVIR